MHKRAGDWAGGRRSGGGRAGVTDGRVGVQWEREKPQEINFRKLRCTCSREVIALVL